MLKRNVKVVSLLVAITSITTMTKVMGEEIAKVETREGTVYNAKAEGNGVFIIDGYINDDDDSGIYYTTDGKKFNKIDNIYSGDNIGDGFEGGRYIEIGDDYDTYVDVKNGYEVVDEAIREDLVDDAAKKVRKKIKKDNDGRLDTDFYYDVDSISAEPVNGGPGTFFTGGFSKQWSLYKYKLTKPKANGDQYTYIYSDLAGNYIDADYNLGKLRVSTTSAGVTMEDTGHTYKLDVDGTPYDVKAVVKDEGFKSEGYFDMYRVINLSIWGRPKGSNDEYVNITDKVKFGNDDKRAGNLNDDNTVTAMQVFSKEQSSESADGIKYPKNSKIYFLTDEDGNDLVDDDCLFMTPYNFATGAYGGFTTSANGITSLFWDQQNKILKAQNVQLKSKRGYNYMELGKVRKIDCDSIDYPGGDLAALSNRYIKLWNPKEEEFDNIYKVDGSLDRFSVSDMNNIILWDSSDENKDNFSIIYNKPKAEETTSTGAAVTATTVVQKGWIENTNGSWSYLKEDGSRATGWIQSPTSKLWYYLDEQGIMSVDKWVKDNGIWYYLKEDGSMARGWIKDNSGKWYYLNESGEMLSNITVDGYQLGIDGAWN